MSDTRAQVVAETLRFLAGGWVHSEDDQRWLRSVAGQIKSGLTPDCCPLCEEVMCDSNCPLASVRSEIPPMNREVFSAAGETP